MEAVKRKPGRPRIHPLPEASPTKSAEPKPSPDGLIYIQITANGRTDCYSFRARSMQGNISSEYRSVAGMGNALHSALAGIFGQMVERL